ncbi:hypothetical protein CP10139811_0079 [Chlamydia ibidis]|uniref:Uncharacterized protein n=2 Tax=Chlamydia ibidis TaxID=1405396 RepID=S7J5Y6_9CHLA|nr:hypothetical protein CP10139811_0079 [Chlamydia ibidis]EQM62608.1 hypothetical protein H359_0522 [Chlamydia ibidis 10-1398/6]
MKYDKTENSVIAEIVYFPGICSILRLKKLLDKKTRWP